MSIASLVLVLSAVPADAQPLRRVTGLSVSVNGTAGNDADFDIDMNTVAGNIYSFTTTTYGRYVGAVPGSLGSAYEVVRSDGASAARIIGILNSPNINAIEFGSTGSTPVANTSISLVTPGVPGAYRGNFIHTYPGPGNYTVRAGAVFNFLYYRATTGSQGVVTGNPVVINPGTAVNLTSVYYFYDNPTNTITATFGPYSASPIAPLTVGVTNFANVAISTVSIPTASEFGLLALALALGLAGVAVLRR